MERLENSGDCGLSYLHKIDYGCDFVVEITDIKKNKVVIVKLKNVSASGGDLYRRIRETLVAWQNKFKLNRINKLTIKVVGDLQNLNIRYYSNLKIPIMHQQLYKKVAHNEEKI